MWPGMVHRSSMLTVELVAMRINIFVHQCCSDADRKVWLPATQCVLTDAVSGLSFGCVVLEMQLGDTGWNIALQDNLVPTAFLDATHIFKAPTTRGWS